MVELTIPFETSFEAAAERKESKYEELVTAARRNGFDATLITIEVGSRGVPNPTGFKLPNQTISLSIFGHMTRSY